MVMEIILASYNKNKAREIEKILAPIRVKCLADLGVDMDFDAVEDADTYRENAMKKVRAAAEHVNGVICADDSGLEVDALGGRPGVHSARYGGPGLDDALRYTKLIEDLDGVPETRRGARFVCVVAVRRPDGREEYFEGELRGVIAAAPRGSSGFGYDPVMYLPDLGKTVAEISADEKNRISHRAQAFKKFRNALLKD